ncbi:MAG: TIGR00282 family metallophosphoesterase [Clostridiales bacterium]|jgi:metallophosphoesterase (TIGR00282 family)|nr:TIGR00282 family metallophosphoesterase [Clostridiales bacterium]
MKLLFLGDVVGRPGREKLTEGLEKLRRQTEADFVIVNGENASGGRGLNQNGRDDLLRAGADVITMGNHVWDNKEIYRFIDDEPRIVRPANYPGYCPGQGLGVYTCGINQKIAVINLCGRIYMPALDCPFQAANELIDSVAAKVDFIVVDFHAEATSEKLALGYYLDGRVQAVVGTHTHVHTADERILAQGTAYITDLGMTGVQDSILGVNKELIIEKFLTQRPTRFGLAEGEAAIQGLLVELDDASKKAVSVRRISE